MTSIGPESIRFRVAQCEIRSSNSPTGAAYPLPVLTEPGSIVISEDQDRENWIEATLQLAWLDEDVFDALDPRDIVPSGGAPIHLRIEELDQDGDVLHYWPGAVVVDNLDHCSLWPVALSRDFATQTVTLTLSSGETLMEDKRRIANTNTNTGATNVRLLVDYALTGVFTGASGYLSSFPAVMTSTLLPAGPRRIMEPGQTYLDLIKTELDAISCRVFDYYGRMWIASARDATYGAAVHLATAPGLQTDADPIVTELVEVRDRGGRYADGVIVKFDTTSYPSGVVGWQASAPASTKDILLIRNRPEPVANAATSVRARAILRGRDIDVTARARLDVRSRSVGVVWARDTYFEGTIRSAEYSFPEGEMRLRIQS